MDTCGISGRIHCRDLFRSRFCGHAFHLTALIAVLVLLPGCIVVPTNQKMSRQTVEQLVKNLPAGSEKRVSLAVLGRPDTAYRIDHNGYPTWRWRGTDDIGACVHIDPETGKPYLETQYSSAKRNATPKYIDFGTDGQNWMCRIHIQRLGINYERNREGPHCEREGRALVTELMQALGT